MAPVGSPEHAKETVSGNPAPVGVTITVYCAGTPAGTVKDVGVTLTPKSFTVTEAALADVWKLEPGTVNLALLPSGGGCDGVVPCVVCVGAAAVSTRVTVALVVVEDVAVFKAPSVQVTVPAVWPHCPGLAVADMKTALVAGGSTSINVTPETKSPRLTMV